jgi:hypothetical protein
VSDRRAGRTLLVGDGPDTVITELDRSPVADLPPVAIGRLSFEVVAGSGQRGPAFGADARRPEPGLVKVSIRR